MHATSQGRTTASFALAGLLRWASFPPRSSRAVLLCALAAMAAVAQAPALAPKAKSVDELKAFYQQNCIRCHGLDGSSRSADGKKLGGLDFTRAARDFHALSGPASEREVQTMVRTIQKGLFFGITMPAWKDHLTQEDANLMVREILLKAEPGKPIGSEPKNASK